MITLLIVWLSGIIPGYLSFKWYWKSDGDKWTVGSRTFCITISLLFSWLCVITSGVIYFIEGLDYEKECKW